MLNSNFKYKIRDCKHEGSFTKYRMAFPPWEPVKMCNDCGKCFLEKECSCEAY